MVPADAGSPPYALMLCMCAPHLPEDEARMTVPINNWVEDDQGVYRPASKAYPQHRHPSVKRGRDRVPNEHAPDPGCPDGPSRAAACERVA
eukprot:gene34035-65352_t